MRIDPKSHSTDAYERAVLRDALAAFLKDRRAKASKVNPVNDSARAKLDTLEMEAAVADDLLARFAD